MNTISNEHSFNWYRMMFLMAFTPCLMMAGIFVGLVLDFGIFSVSNITLNSQIFTEKYAWVVWFVGFWSTVQLIAIIPMFIISISNKKK